MCRCREKICRYKGDHLRIPAAILAQVKDEGIDVGQEVHRGDSSVPADFRVGKAIELHISNVAAKVFHSFKRTIGISHRLPVSRHGVRAGRGWILRQLYRTKAYN